MIRCFSAGDRPWVTKVAALVYLELGDYARIIASWLDHPGVFAFVEQSDLTAERRAFALLGFCEPPEGPPGTCIADLLAIAVAPPFQRQGIGRSMLTHVMDVAESLGRRWQVGEIRLTVADGNQVGQHLYTSAGFRVLDPEHGRYDGGQRAIRMVRSLPLPPRSLSSHRPSKTD